MKLKKDLLHTHVPAFTPGRPRGQGRSQPFHRLRHGRLAACGLGLVLFWVSPARADQNITLAWEANSDPNVVGYRVHYGVGQGLYSNSVNVSTNTVATISGLQEGVSYYFVVKAYDQTGRESDPSNEVTYAPPVTSVLGRVTAGFSRTPRPACFVSFQALQGYFYEVQWSDDLLHWTPFHWFLPVTNSMHKLADIPPEGVTRRFYRMLGKRLGL